MSGYVQISGKKRWWASGLFVNTLLDYVSTGYAPDADARDALANCSILDSLSLDDYDDELRVRLARMIYTVAKDTCDGKIELRPLINTFGNDLRTEYRKSLAELVALFEADGRYNIRLEADGSSAK